MANIGVRIEAVQDSATLKQLASAGDRIVRKILTPGVKIAAKIIADTMKQGVPVQFGLMRQAVGVGPFKTYRGGNILYQAAGVRQTFGRPIMAQQTQSGTVKIKKGKIRGKTKAEKKYARTQGILFRDPAKIAGIVSKGRGPSVAGVRVNKKTGKASKALFNPVSGRVFKRSSAAKGAGFIQAAQSTADNQAGTVLRMAVTQSIGTILSGD